MTYYYTPSIKPEYLAKIEDIVYKNGNRLEYDKMMPVNTLTLDGETEDFIILIKVELDMYIQISTEKSGFYQF